ncbi:MAG: sensor histidine kinase [Clostridia bacterium]
MKNKVELKKAILTNCIVIFIICIIFQICMFYQYTVYTDNFNQKIGMIISNVKSKYPNVDTNELIKILNDKTDIDLELFKEYGIDLDRDSILIQNDKNFVKFSVVNLCFLIGLATIVLFTFIKYNKEKDQKLKEITRYIEEINNRNYKLDIEDNTEDELSILKNEIYKTTVMLKEVAENSVQDKVNLKNSLSDISHQLKTPLTSMSVMIDNILDNPQMDEDIKSEFIKDIRRGIININFLVNTLLKLSKLDANSVHFINKNVCVNDIINESIKNVSVLCDLKNINIVVNGGKEIRLCCDIKWQVEAITNILKNCIEHSPENSKIEIEYEENNVYIKIQIRDHGIGINEQDLPHIFERFYKGKNSSNESVGIGLSLTKSIVEKNNGYIEAQSEEGIGTTFEIKYFK